MSVELMTGELGVRSRHTLKIPAPLEASPIALSRQRLFLLYSLRHLWLLNGTFPISTSHQAPIIGLERTEKLRTRSVSVTGHFELDEWIQAAL